MNVPEKVFFLDRDGVLIEDENYLSDPAKVRLCSRVPEALACIRSKGYGIVVVSNQSGIARGYFTIEQLKAIEKRIDELLAEQGQKLDAVYYCYHHKKGVIPEYAKECDCRKPEPGLLLQAAKDFHLDLSQCVIVGDKTSDLEAGYRAGCRKAALVRTGHGNEQDLTSYPQAVDAENLYEAVKQLI